MEGDNLMSLSACVKTLTFLFDRSNFSLIESSSDFDLFSNLVHDSLILP